MVVPMLPKEEGTIKSIRIALTDAGFKWNGKHRILISREGKAEEGKVPNADYIIEITDDDPILDNLVINSYNGPSLVAEDEYAIYFSGDCADNYVIYKVSKNFADYLLPGKAWKFM